MLSGYGSTALRNVLFLSKYKEDSRAESFQVDSFFKVIYPFIPQEQGI